MKIRTKARRLREASQLIVILLVIWIVIAEIVFSIRHPWATDTERFLHTIDALLFKEVPYNKMRPRE